GVGIGDGGEDPLSPPADALDAQLPHQPGHLVPADLMAGASGGLPELVGPVDLAVRDPQREQDLGHHRVADGPSRRLDLAAPGGVVGARSDLQDSADRLDSELVTIDRKSTRLNSSHVKISYAVFCAKKKKNHLHQNP